MFTVFLTQLIVEENAKFISIFPREWILGSFCKPDVEANVLSFAFFESEICWRVIRFALGINLVPLGCVPKLAWIVPIWGCVSIWAGSAKKGRADSSVLN